MLIYSILTAFLGSFLFGYTTCVIAGAILFLGEQFDLSPLKEGFLVSIILFGAMIGSAVAGTLTDKLGRRRALLWTGAVFVAGILLSISSYFEVVLVGRAITGIGVGLASAIVPIYLAEISDEKHRGKVGSMTMVGIALGLFCAYVANYFLASSGNWQMMFGLAIVPALGLFVGMFFAIDSPVLSRSHLDEGTIKLWSPSSRNLVIIGAVLSLAQQLTGINVVNYYAPQIYQTAGFKSHELATNATLGIGFITVLSALFATWLMDKWGRRPLLLSSLAGMSVALGVLSIAYLVDSPSLGLMALITLPAYTAFFTIGMGAVLWVYLSEIYPLTIRAKAMSFVVLINWLANYVISLVFPPLEEVWGTGGLLMLFAVFNIITLFFVMIFVSETKGQKLAK